MYNTQTNRPACCNRVKRVAAANSKYDGRCKQKTASRIDRCVGAKKWRCEAVFRKACLVKKVMAQKCGQCRRTSADIYDCNRRRQARCEKTQRRSARKSYPAMCFTTKGKKYSSCARNEQKTINLKIPRFRYEEVETGTERQRQMSKGKVELGKTYSREKKN